MRGQSPRWRWLVAGGGTLLAVGALATAIAWNAIFDAVMASQVVLSPGSRSYREWVAPSIPLYFDIYMFNWTNADRFPEEKPMMDQLGPYRFREYRKHVNVTWHPNNYTVSYQTQRTWFFDPDGSNGTLDDNITTLNIIAASAVYRSRFWGFLRQKALSMGLAMFGQHFSISRLARELLFEGYEDPLLDMAKTLPASATGGAPVYDRFGLFYGLNNSIGFDGVTEVTTGQVQGTIPGQILTWNYEKQLPYYEDECSKLIGSAGEFMPRNLTEDTKLTMFVSDLCRTVHMEYVDSGEQDGVGYHKYAMAETSFDYSPLSSANTCFCNGDCLWSGVMNVSACRFGSPTFLSLPHFLHGDSRLRDLVDGMDPDPGLHSFYFAVEPRLGVPIDVAGRFQMNMYIEASPNIALYEDVPTMLFPIFWVEQKVKVDPSVTGELRMVRAIHDWGGIVCAGAALAFAVLVALATCCYKKTRTHYVKADLIAPFEMPKDEAEMKLNPI